MYSNVLIMPWIKAFWLPNSLACGPPVSAANRLYLLIDSEFQPLSADACCVLECKPLHMFSEKFCNLVFPSALNQLLLFRSPDHRITRDHPICSGFIEFS